jgi:two-component system, LuxR family, sensor kinase FixL
VGTTRSAESSADATAASLLSVVTASTLLTPRMLTVAAALAVAYYCGVRVGMALTFESQPVSTLWPPNAILLVALLLTPSRRWWFLCVAVLPAHLIAEISVGVPFAMAACWFVSNVAEAVLGAVLMLRYLGRIPQFDRVRDVSVFLVVAGMLAPVISSFLDAGFVAQVGWRYSDYWHIWLSRTLSNSLAAVILVPLIVMGARGGFHRLWRLRLAESVETAALLIGICASSVVVFQQSHPPAQSPVLMCAPLPFLMWAAIRRGVSGVSICFAVVAMFAITGVLKGRGPFAAASPESAARAVQTFLLIAACSLMLLAASLAELKHARADAMWQMQSLNLALGAARLGIWEWEMGADRLFVQGRAPITEKTANRAFPRTFAELLDGVPPEDRPLLTRAVSDAAERGRAGNVEFRIRRSDGSTVWISGRGRVIRDAAGKPRRMMGVYSDTTRRKSEEAQLIVQREQIARLNRVSLLGELSGALAHELLQPITAILSNAEAARLMLATATPNMKEIDKIERDDERMSEVIRRLRALFVRGEVQPVQPVDVNACITEVLELERSYLMAHSVTAGVLLDAGLPLAPIHRVQLEQVLINLITNACDAMRDSLPEERHLEISSAPGEDHEIDIRVCDSGVGIKNTEAIFEPYFTTKSHGIGLGLAICRTIIAAHGGRVWASNNPIRGATLHISLPAAFNCSQGTDESKS